MFHAVAPTGIGDDGGSTAGSEDFDFDYFLSSISSASE